MSAGGLVPVEVCAGLVEEALRETLTGRFFHGTVEEVLVAARGKVEQLRTELDQVQDGPQAHHGSPEWDGRQAHRGPVEAGCAVTCLGLSLHAFLPLTRWQASGQSQAPQTVGDVLALARAGRLRDARGLGVTRVREIEQALEQAGFNLANPDDHHHTPASDAAPALGSGPAC